MTYTEDALVEQPAIKLFEALDWDTLNCWDEDFGVPHPNKPHPSPLLKGEGIKKEVYLGHQNRGDVVLANRLRSALEKLNPNSTKLAIDEAIEALPRDRSVMRAVVTNREIYATSEGKFKHGRYQ